MKTHNVIAVIPVHGRLELLKHTIQRLLNKNGVKTVICVGETKEEQAASESAGAVFLKHRNKPLGRKWNFGFQQARKYNPDAILFVGSSDWLSENWLDETMVEIEKGFDVVGVLGYSMLDINSKIDTYRSCHWTGYGPGLREDEPIGIGRVISARMLEVLNYQPFDPNMDNSMDWQMYMSVMMHRGRIMILDYPELTALSISTDLWPNKHKFEDHWNDKVPEKTIRIDVKEIIEQFPEALKIFNQ